MTEPTPEAEPAEPSIARAELAAACACVDSPETPENAADRATFWSQCADAAITDAELQAWWDSLADAPSTEAKITSLRAQMRRVGLEQCRLEDLWTRPAN